MCLLSYAQSWLGMGRTFSSVTALAFDRSSAGATQMLSTPLTGAWKLIHFPSWLSRAWARCGLPKSTSRGMSVTLAFEVCLLGVARFSVAGGRSLPVAEWENPPTNMDITTSQRVSSVKVTRARLNMEPSVGR